MGIQGQQIILLPPRLYKTKKLPCSGFGSNNSESWDSGAVGRSRIGSGLELLYLEPGFYLCWTESRMVLRKEFWKIKTCFDFILENFWQFFQFSRRHCCFQFKVLTCFGWKDLRLNQSGSLKFNLPSTNLYILLFLYNIQLFYHKLLLYYFVFQ